MKNASLLFVVLLVIVAFSSCKKESAQVETDKIGFEKLGVSPKDIGILHNKLMSYTNKNWAKFSSTRSKTLRLSQATIEELSIQEADVLHSFTNAYLTSDYSNYALSQTQLYDIVYNINLGYYNEYKQQYPNEETDAYEIAPALYVKERNEVNNLLNSLYAENLLSSKEKTFLESALLQFEQIETTRNYSLYPSLLAVLQNQYLNQRFNESVGEGFLASVFLEVANNSYNYWYNVYPTELSIPISSNNRVQAIPLWVGLDAAGALAGAGGSLWSQQNNASIDWWEVGGQAVIWGGGSSLPGTRWFNTLFKL